MFGNLMGLPVCVVRSLFSERLWSALAWSSGATDEAGSSAYKSTRQSLGICIRLLKARQMAVFR